MKKGRILLAGVVCCLLLFIFPGAVLADDNNLLQETREIISENYVDAVGDNVLSTGDPRQMLERLGDPYSQYFTAAEFQMYMDSFDYSFSGVGVYMEMCDDGVLVKGVFPGSPAETAGVRAGDIIHRAEGNLMVGLTSEEAASILMGPSGSIIELEILRNKQTFVVDLTREEIYLPTVIGSMRDYHIGYMQISSFGADTGAEMIETIPELMALEADKWVVDLRGNPGGYLDAASLIGGTFIDTGNMVIIQERNRRTHLPAVNVGTRMQGPVVVLVDRDSASASEIVSAAVKDYRKAVLVGETTYGKGTVQQFFALSNGDYIKLTIARFYSPFGTAINHKGIDPDIKTESSRALEAAELLLADPQEMPEGCIYFDVQGYGFGVDLSMARQDEYWEAWQDIVDSTTGLLHYFNKDKDEKQLLLGAEQINDIWPVYFPDYDYLGEYTARAGQPIPLYIAPQTIDSLLCNDGIELIDSQSGERLPLQEVEHGLQPVREQTITPGDYWLVLNGAPGGDDLAVIHYF